VPEQVRADARRTTALAVDGALRQKEDGMTTPQTGRPALPAGGAGWIIFSGTMLILAGLIDIFDGIWALSAPDVVSDTFDAQGGTFIWDNLDAWGVIYLLVGIGLVATGYFIYQREPWAVTVGIVAAGVGLVVHMFWIFAFPIASLVLVILNLLVLYGLLVYGTDERERAY
jgi:hypothetical protein